MKKIKILKKNLPQIQKIQILFKNQHSQLYNYLTAAMGEEDNKEEKVNQEHTESIDHQYCT
jgi:CO dehydrogenase/acetyl-CoA synthase beta subunit